MANITIRKARLSDAKGIAEVSKQGLKQKTWLYTGINKYTSEKFKQLKGFLSTKNSTFKMFIAIDKKSKKIVGQLGYSFRKTGRQKHIIGLGWGVYPGFEGQGIGTKLLKYALEHAKKKGFKRAEAEVAVKNTGSIRMAEKNGFNLEGTKRKALLTDEGKYLDVYVFGKLL